MQIQTAQVIFLLIPLNLVCALTLLTIELLKPPRRWRAWLIAISLASIVLAVVQFSSGYFFAFPLASFAVGILAVAAYLLVMALLWLRKAGTVWCNRIVAGIGIALPIASLISAGRELVVLLAVIGGMNGVLPVAQDRISPTQSYRVVVDHRLWGATPYYAYRIYRNPRWFPLVEKKTNEGPISCDDAPASGVSIQRDPKQDILQAVCRYPGRETFVQNLQF